jgi:hypothetical protein
MIKISVLAQLLFAVLVLATESLRIVEASQKDEAKLSAHWLLKLDTDNIELARRIASEHNFNVVRQVGKLEGYYIVESVHHRARRSSDSSVDVDHLVENSAQKLSAHPSVEQFEREKVLSRKKRDYVEDVFSPLDLQTSLLSEVRASRLAPAARLLNRRMMMRRGNPNEDPFWGQMWYLNRNLRDSMSPDMNVTAAWAMGYSGRGVSVTFLDDGLEWDHPDLQQNYDPKVIYFSNSCSTGCFILFRVL